MFRNVESGTDSKQSLSDKYKHEGFVSALMVGTSMTAFIEGWEAHDSAEHKNGIVKTECAYIYAYTLYIYFHIYLYIHIYVYIYTNLSCLR